MRPGFDDLKSFSLDGFHEMKVFGAAFGRRGLVAQTLLSVSIGARTSRPQPASVSLGGVRHRQECLCYTRGVRHGLECLCYTRGRETVNVAPRPGLFCIEIVPRWASTMRLQMLRPRP